MRQENFIYDASKHDVKLSITELIWKLSRLRRILSAKRINSAAQRQIRILRIDFKLFPLKSYLIN